MTVKKILSNLIVFVITALLVCGCATVSIPKAGVPGQVISSDITLKNYNITVAVMAFKEKRANINKYGSVYRYLVPLVAYGQIKYERPDEARIFNTGKELMQNMTDNLSRIFFNGIKQARIFDNVVYNPPLEDSGADLILTAEVNSTVYEGKTYSYGISFLCPVLWCVGLPAGSSYNKLNITLYLHKAYTGELIWSYVLNKEETIVQGLYYNWGKDLNNYTSLMQEGIEEVLSDLRKKLSGLTIEELKVKPAAVSQQEITQEKEPTAVSGQ